MTDTKPRDYIGAIIIFTIVAVSGSLILADSFSSDKIDLDVPVEFEDFQDAVDKRANIENMTSDFETRIKQADLPAPITFVSLLFIKGFQVLGNLFNALEFFDAVIVETFTIFDFIIPSWVADMIVALVTIMLVFSIVGAILQRDL